MTGEPYIRFYAGYPVHLPDGAVAGTLCLIHTTPREFNDEEIAVLKDLAGVVKTLNDQGTELEGTECGVVLLPPVEQEEKE